MSRITVRNLQRTVRVQVPVYRHMAEWLAYHLIETETGCLPAFPRGQQPLQRNSEHEFSLSIVLAGSKESARINEQFLGHQGSTDVISFSYAGHINGPCELIICPEVAVAQAESFHTSWTEELARYLVHGILHLLGYEDETPAARKVMKKKETAVLRRLLRFYPANSLNGGGAKAKQKPVC